LSDGNKKNSFKVKNQEQKLMTLSRFLALNKVCSVITVNTGQNITAICKGLEEETNGVLHWEPFPEQPEQRRDNREIYTNSLEVKFFKRDSMIIEVGKQEKTQLHAIKKYDCRDNKKLLN
jgi:hypothetical protein